MVLAEMLGNLTATDHDYGTIAPQPGHRPGSLVVDSLPRAVEPVIYFIMPPQ